MALQIFRFGVLNDAWREEFHVEFVTSHQNRIESSSYCYSTVNQQNTVYMYAISSVVKSPKSSPELVILIWPNDISLKIDGR